MQSYIIPEQMYVVRKGTLSLAWGLWVGHALAHQNSGQEQGHTLAVLCLPEYSPMSTSVMFAVILIVPEMYSGR